MIKFANFEFMFAIKGSILGRRDVKDKLIQHKIEGLFYMHLWNDFARTLG